MKIRTLAFIIVVALAFQVRAAEKSKPATSSAKPSVTNDAVVARVNGSEISRKELDAAVRAMTMQMARRGRQSLPPSGPELESGMLDELIGRELLLQEGSKHPGADVEQKTQAQIELVKKQLGGEEGYKTTLAETGITPEEYAKRVHDNVIIQETVRNIVEKQVKVTPEEVKSFYDENPDQFKQSETVRASHILIRVPPGASDDVKKEKRAQIEAALSLVKGGEKFADVARKVSEDPGSAANGGDLGFFPRGAMVPEFDAAAFSLPTNTVSGVITTQFGYHILLVTDRRPARVLPFDEVKEDLTQFLKRRKGDQATREHVAELRKAAKVEVLLPPPPSLPAVETPPVSTPVAK
ncbi:MAG TPA: peptidylprolyl isomerase [Verrucomicrobiae bacterium]|nr:peptidylprolyl isomerase [Verrucomicrobiae bacterium]